MTINRVVPPLSTCDKQLDDTFSKFLISYSQNQPFRDKVLQVFNQPNEDVKMTYVHKKNKFPDNISGSPRKSFQKMGISQTIDGIGNYADSNF